MSIKGTSQELYVGKKESNIISFWGNKKKIEYDDLKRIDYMYASGTEIGYFIFVGCDNQKTRFEFAKNVNEKISRAIDLIKDSTESLEICEQRTDGLKFYQRNLFTIIISFVLGFPLGLIGLYLMWYYKKSHRAARLLVTFMAFLFWGTCGYLSYLNYKSAVNQTSEAIQEYQNVLGAIYSSDSTSEQQESTGGNSKYKDTYKAGTYKIGKDIPAGEYVLFAELADVNYFQISNDSSGEITSISANGTFKTNTIVTVSNGQYLNFIGCYAVPITEVTELDTSKEGMFKIGIHLEPGEYQLWKTDGSDVSYYAVMKDSTHKIESIKVNGVIENREYVTVEKGDYLELQGCYIIE